jgi:Flp pilus assembly protein TadD
MYRCPSCESSVQDFELMCPRCDVDLRILARLNELPDVQFNQALRAAKAGDWATSTMLLGALLSVRMTDVGGWYLQGVLYAQRGFWDLARECWRTVLLFQPNEPRAKRGLAMIEQLIAKG